MIGAKVLSADEATKMTNEYTSKLEKCLKSADDYEPQATYLRGRWSKIERAGAKVTTWDTGCDLDLLRYVGRKSVEYPEMFDVHPELREGHIAARLRQIEEGRDLDWPTAEAMAFGSLLLQGYDARLSGEHVERGTFVQRHAVLIDQSTGRSYVPLNAVTSGANNDDDKIGKIEVANSVLLGGGRAGLRVRLERDLARLSDRLGGAVRRLLQRRPVDDRHLRERRRDQVAARAAAW
uniref:Transketolase-like pyrimidine-binding domain-containing protein n=1 Tax=Trichogramma kaykai TaxID=54128 RepID=A0ABD2WJ13_9HYME